MVKTELRADTNWVFNTEEIIDLRQHLTDPTILETNSIHPSTVIILLGESFSKNHSSLYGYDKETNPNLSVLKSDSSLYILNNVKSPAPNTTKAFKFILNNHTLQDANKGEKWYNSTTIIEALSKAGYHTSWISNQSRVGMFDNLPSGHSNICDESFFCIEAGLDNYLLTVDTDKIKKNYDKNCIIYHFMGQHENIALRFPSEYKKYTSADYSNHKENQRQVLADYDNATLYNDYIVSELIKKYSNDDAIIFYFTDHALDIFDTSDDYYGHARGDQESINHCLDIPFMIYVSPSYKIKDPSIKAKINGINNENFCTENFFNLVLELIGYKMM